MSIIQRIRNAWNAFTYNEQHYLQQGMYEGPSSSSPQYKQWRYSKGSIIDTIVNKIAIDVSMVAFDHVKMDHNPDTEEIIDDGLQDCLSVEANIDQTPVDFFQDLTMTMFDQGVCAVVPVETTNNPNVTESYDILSLRVGRIIEWYPTSVRVELYNQLSGRTEQIVLKKSYVGIIENPLYTIVNGNNSTLKRLMHKLSLMDILDDKNMKNPMALIIQLPYEVRDDTRSLRAKKRVEELEKQLSDKGNGHGIAYIGATEKITQLSHVVENKLLDEVDYLTQELYNQLGLSKGVFNGTASEAEMNSYYDRTIQPIAKRISLEFTRKFISKTGRTQGQAIVYHTDPFRLVPVNQLASALDTLRRNTILSTNECRKIIGFQPSDDPRADQLFNPNIADSNQNQNGMEPPAGTLPTSDDPSAGEEEAMPE